jgi:hypothetical protein
MAGAMDELEHRALVQALINGFAKAGKAGKKQGGRKGSR